MTGSQSPEGMAAKAAVKVETMSKPGSTNFLCQGSERTSGRERKDPIDIWIVADQRGERLLGNHRHACIRMAMPDCAEERGSEKDIADRAEPDDENVRSVGHGVKVQRQELTVNRKQPKQRRGDWETANGRR
jgi:hypothetical protein